MRTRRGSATEEGSDAATGFPWWAYLLLAPVAYFGLDTFTSPPSSLPALGNTDSPLHATLMTLQYVLPALCLLGAGLALRMRLLRGGRSASGERALADLTRAEFEALAREWFRRHGLTERGFGAREVCLVLTADGRLRLVQCKAWEAPTVGAGVVQELFELMAAQRADGGYVVTTGRFTDDARRYASGKHIGLIDGAQLLSMSPAAPAPSASSTGTATPAA